MVTVYVDYVLRFAFLEKRIKNQESRLDLQNEANQDNRVNATILILAAK